MWGFASTTLTISPRTPARLRPNIAAVVVLPVPPFGHATTTWCEPGTRANNGVAIAAVNRSISVC